jgi:hypothetical protein
VDLTPITRSTRLFARRVVNIGSGARLLPGQELITNPKGPGALSWRRIVQLYEQRRVVSEADPYFEELMRDCGLANNPEFAKSWLGETDDTHASVMHKGGGWYDVLRDGMAVNDKPLRKDEADALANSGDILG